MFDTKQSPVCLAVSDGGAPLQAQVLERIKEPLQTLMSRDQYETAYAVLAHFLLLAQRAPSLFSQARCLRQCTLCAEGSAQALWQVVAVGAPIHGGAVGGTAGMRQQHESSVGA